MGTPSGGRVRASGAGGGEAAGERPDEGRASEGGALYGRVLAAECRLDFGLVGERLGHSHSPAIHAVLGSTPYRLVEVPRDRVGAFFATRAYRGLNVTIPYKRDAAAACDELSEAARRLGNVNTLVVRPDGSLFGDNTDYHGFACELASTGVDVAGRACLVLGDGGAAATVRAVLADAGAARIVTAARRSGSAPAVFASDGRGVPSERVELSRLADPGDAQGAALRRDVEVVVNATPVGTFPHADDAALVDLAAFPRLVCVCDLVYNPLSTRLVQAGRSLGVPSVGGLSMLVAQAKRSSDLFLGVERPDGIERAVLTTMLGRLSCVSLIGMPGCGKTRTGRAVAKLLGYGFVDVDDLVCMRSGESVEDLFAKRGEEGFRELETACTAEALSRPGVVVACGGGVVTRERNLFYLRQNGPVVLLTRGLDEGDGERLSTEGRPLSRAKGVERIRAERAPLYRAWADIEVAPVPGDAYATAERVADAVRAWLVRRV